MTALHALWREVERADLGCDGPSCAGEDRWPCRCFGNDTRPWSWSHNLAVILP